MYTFYFLLLIVFRICICFIYGNDLYIFSRWWTSCPREWMGRSCHRRDRRNLGEGERHPGWIPFSWIDKTPKMAKQKQQFPPIFFIFFLPKEQWSLYCFLYLLQSWNEALLYTVFFGYFIYSLIYYHLFIIIIIIIIYFFFTRIWVAKTM